MVGAACGPVGARTPRTLRRLVRLSLLQPVDAGPQRALADRALVAILSINGPNHPNTADALSRVAKLYKDSAEYSEALALHERALSIRSRRPDTTGPARGAVRRSRTAALDDTRPQLLNTA